MTGTARDAHYVFGYGSLLELRDPREERGGEALTEIVGYARGWSVAMDNSVDLPGYKYYVDPRTGARPAVFVTFLNIEPAAGSRVNGTLIRAAPEDLARLDARERNYARADVSAAVLGAIEGTVWAYIGTPAARARFASGFRSARAVIQQRYHDRVRREFAAVARDGLAEFERLTRPPQCPIVALRRVDL